MKWTQRFFSLALVLALSATVSCSAGDSPTTPAATQEDDQQAYLLGNLFEG